MVCSIFSSAASLSSESPEQASPRSSLLAGRETSAMLEAKLAFFAPFARIANAGLAFRAAMTGLAIFVLLACALPFSSVTKGQAKGRTLPKFTQRREPL
ncbi:MAG TPA: hypothetical protein VJN89_12840 [Candidatus Acidoferrum sp.]|nr:hypothetical protein [Candidatus Acidoferrum sp.]